MWAIRAVKTGCRMVVEKLELHREAQEYTIKSGSLHTGSLVKLHGELADISRSGTFVDACY
jgi:hypothetical protein